MLKLLKNIDYVVQDRKETSVFLPKPFVFADMISPEYTKVYLPGQTYTPLVDGFPLTNHRMYVCVHMCKQFLNYPTTTWGIRCIPSRTKCPFGGFCYGDYLMLRGKNTGIRITMKNEMFAGLAEIQKTK